VKIIACEQGTDEWKAARAGHVTASRMADVLAKIAKGEAASRRDYKAQIVAEILTGQPIQDGFTNAAMQWGNEQEPFARGWYEITTGVDVEQVGFVLHPNMDRCGASPDGLVGSDGLVQIKCPKTATHISYLLGKVVPVEYQPQMLWEMACSERQWCDFVSYDPRLPEHLRLFIARFERDNKRIATMEDKTYKFLAEVDEILRQLPQK
jgi:putative phage-type endonuclease